MLRVRWLRLRFVFLYPAPKLTDHTHGVVVSSRSFECEDCMLRYVEGQLSEVLVLWDLVVDALEIGCPESKKETYRCSTWKCL